MTRFPDGIDGKSFYQKDAPEFAPRVDPHDPDLERGHAARDPLLRLRRRGIAALHRQPRLHPAAHLGEPRRLARAARLVRDRSRSEGSAVLRRRCARAQVLHALCESIGLPNYVKTTGKTGLHILLPLGRQCTYEQSRTLGELLARVVLRETKRHRDDHAPRDEARRQGLSRLSAEPARPDDRRAIQRAPAARARRCRCRSCGTR